MDEDQKLADVLSYPEGALYFLVHIEHLPLQPEKNLQKTILAQAAWVPFLNSKITSGVAIAVDQSDGSFAADTHRFS